MKNINPKIYLAIKKDIGHQVGMVLEEARAKKGLTQKQLAEMIGTQQPSIARVESGSQIPSLRYLAKIAEALGTYLIPPTFAGINTPSKAISDAVEMSKQGWLEQGRAEARQEFEEMVRGMNNFRQAKVDGKDDWNEALEQSANKADALLAHLSANKE